MPTPSAVTRGWLPGAQPENLWFGLFGWLGCYYAWIPLTPIAEAK